jgi:hypothetical protein
VPNECLHLVGITGRKQKTHGGLDEAQDKNEKCHDPGGSTEDHKLGPKGSFRGEVYRLAALCV